MGRGRGAGRGGVAGGVGPGGAPGRGGGAFGPGGRPPVAPPPPRVRPPRPRTGWFLPRSYGYGGPRGYGGIGGYGGGARRPAGGGSGCLTAVVLLILVFMLTPVLAPLIFGDGSRQSGGAEGITVSTTNREPLGPEACVASPDWYEDQAGWGIRESRILPGLRTFYQETGVQPYVIIADSINGKGGDLTQEEAEAYLAETYDSLFDDGGHLIFLFLEYQPNDFEMYLYMGNQASSVIDMEAEEIIYDYAVYYYSAKLADDEYFSTVFEKSAERIMRKTTTANDVKLRLVTVIGAAAVIGLIGYLIVKRQKAAAAEAEERRKILETPVQKMEDEELKDKYSDDIE